MGSASSSGKSAAKECLWNAVLGILLAVGSWLILNTINPNLIASNVTLTQISTTPGPQAVGPGKPGGPPAVTEPMPTIPGWYFRYKDADGNIHNSTRFGGADGSPDECLETQREYQKYPGITIVNGPDGKPGCFEIFRSTETPSGGETATRNALCGNDSCISSSATNVYINKGPCVGGQTNCTNVAGLPGNAVSFLQSLPGACGCTVTITGGTEPGHLSHGVDRPIFDVRKTPEMISYVENGRTADASFGDSRTGKPYSKWLVDGWWFTDETVGVPHFHVCQDGYTGPGSGIACKKSQ